MGSSSRGKGSRKPTVPPSRDILGWEFVTRTDLPGGKSWDEGDYGHTDLDRREISYNPDSNATQEQLELTILHEDIHAIFGITGISELLSDELEEAIVRSLENGLGRIYRRVR